MLKEYILEGLRITSVESFYDEVSRVLIPDAQWGRNLDAFNDVLRGGFGTPEEGFVLRWKNSDASKERLGPRVFDLIVEIIRGHGPNGDEQEDNVVLMLQ